MSAEKKKFQTEVSQLLDLVIHSLYSNKDIFLRELISNASDAIDKARYEGITKPEIYEGDTDWMIRIVPDESSGTLTISDNGIGMSKDEAVKLLGTIAHSGTKEFLKRAEKSGNASEISNLIGQFGVGFYSAFMVADNVTVVSRRRGAEADEAVKWESDAKSHYTVENTSKETPGTDIILHLKEDQKNYLNEYTIRHIVSEYSDFIEYPVKMRTEKPVQGEDGKPSGEIEVNDDTLNSMKALWLKDKAEVTEDELNLFYKHITKDFLNPAKTISIRAEGTSEFYALLFIPEKQPFDLFHIDTKYGPMLYVRRVQIMEHCEDLVPQYLRFLKGVVDSSDLPLNVSRELLQNSRQIALIKKNIIKKVLDTLEDMLRNDYEKYKAFYAEFGKVLKEGIHVDFERREAIAALCLFESTNASAGSYTTLDDYISRMKSDQKDIYFITGGSRQEMENSPYIEGLKVKGYEVLFMTDEFDDIIFSGLAEYKDKHLKSVLKGDMDIDGEVSEEIKEKYEHIMQVIKEALGEKVSDVRLTSRLNDSPVCLVTGEGAPDAQMERLLKAMGQAVPKVKRTLELNPSHPILEIMAKGLIDTKIAEYAGLLYDEAVLLEGGKLDNAVDFAVRLNKLIQENADSMIF